MVLNCILMITHLYSIREARLHGGWSDDEILATI